MLEETGILFLFILSHEQSCHTLNTKNYAYLLFK